MSKARKLLAGVAIVVVTAGAVVACSNVEPGEADPPSLPAPESQELADLLELHDSIRSSYGGRPPELLELMFEAQVTELRSGEPFTLDEVAVERAVKADARGDQVRAHYRPPANWDPMTGPPPPPEGVIRRESSVSRPGVPSAP